MDGSLPADRLDLERWAIHTSFVMVERLLVHGLRDEADPIG